MLEYLFLYKKNIQYINYSIFIGFSLIKFLLFFSFAGELKMVLSLVTNLEPREQRLLFKGKEREDNEYLHMVGVGDKDKLLLLQDPALKERKLHSLARGQRQPIGTAPFRTISV